MKRPTTQEDRQPEMPPMPGEGSYGRRLGFGAAAVFGLVLVALAGFSAQETEAVPEGSVEAAEELSLFSVEEGKWVSVPKISKSDEEWKGELPADVYQIVRQQGTERAFTGELLANKEAGIYRCAACGTDLFLSQAKYESGTGWPSFWQPVADANVATEIDATLGMVRTEVLCPRCGAHLGHVFDDGPKPTGQRYCINSKALAFKPWTMGVPAARSE